MWYSGNALPTPNIISLASKLCQSQCLRSLYLTAILHNAQHPSSPPTKKATETRLGVHDGHFTTKSFVKSKAVSALFCCESRSFSRISRTVQTIGSSLIINYVFFLLKIAPGPFQKFISWRDWYILLKNTVPVSVKSC